MLHAMWLGEITIRHRQVWQGFARAATARRFNVFSSRFYYPQLRELLRADQAALDGGSTLLA